MEMSSRSLVIPPEANLPQRHPDAPKPGQSVPSHYNQCFGCGIDHPTGLHMVVTAGHDLTVSAEFEVTAHHQGAPGIAHGGLLSLAFDEALGATNWLLRVSAVTAHLQVSYRAPVPVGSRVFISAKIDGMQRRKIWSSAIGRLETPDGLLAVEAAALFIAVDVEHFKKHGRAVDIEQASLDPSVRNHLRNLDIAP